MHLKSLWSMLLAAALLLPLSARAADNGNWDDGWAYFDSDDTFANPEPEMPAPVDATCLNGINHYGSPCTCPPTEPAGPILDIEPIVCENPFGNDDIFLTDLRVVFAEMPNFSIILPMQQVVITCCGNGQHRAGCGTHACGHRQCETSHNQKGCGHFEAPHSICQTCPHAKLGNLGNGNPACHWCTPSTLGWNNRLRDHLLGNCPGDVVD